MIRIREGFINYLTLFSSISTLICCALPALLVSLGLGAVLAGLASNVPELIWVSENKALVFFSAGVLLAGNGLIQWVNRNAPCPTDPSLRDLCIKGRRTSKHLYFVSLVIYLIGFTFAYILPSI